MGFTNLDVGPAGVDGYSDVLQNPPDPAHPEAELVRDLLELFDPHG